MKAKNLTVSICVVCALAGCGGGGGSSPGSESRPSNASPNPSPSAYLPSDQIGLSGQLIVNELPNQPRTLDLTNGSVQLLPRSDNGSADDFWTASQDGEYFVRWATADWLSQTPIWIFDKKLAQRWNVTLERKIRQKRPQLSADGKYILSFYRDVDNGDVLAIFDARTGAILKQGSLLDGETISGGAPASWLPDGSYVYLLGNHVILAHPDRYDDLVIAELALPPNDVTGTSIIPGKSELVASPDGKQIAFSWAEKNGLSYDTHVWVSNLNGDSLHRVTETPVKDAGYGFSYDSPSWSPDGKWLAISLHMSGASAAPVFLDEPFLGGRVLGTTGCASSPVYVVPASSKNLLLSWPRQDPAYSLRVANAGSVGGKWLTTCGTAFWSK